MPYMVSQWKIPWHGSCDGRLSVILWCDQWKRTRYGRSEFCRKVSASFSIFSVQWISSGDAVKLLMESMRSHCILPAVMWQRESIINTYENHQISAVDMHREDLDSEALICYPVIQGEKIHFQNWCSKNERRASGWKRKSFRSQPISV